MIIILFITFIFLLLISFIIFDKDIMAPAFIFCAMYVVSIGLALTEYNEWLLQDYSIMAYCIYTGGAILFILIGYIIKIGLGVGKTNIDADSLSPINVNKISLFIFLLIDILALLLLIKDIKSMTGGGSLNHMTEMYRSLTSYSTDAQLPGYDQQLNKIVTVSAYICGFVLINNLMVGGFQKIDLMLSIPLFIYFLYGLFLSNRLIWLELIGGLVTYYCLLRPIKYGSKNQSIKLLINVILVFILVLVLFYLVRLIVGRTASRNTGMLDYLAMYIGGPVKLFDMYLKNPVYSDFWGKETFYGLIRNMRSLGLVDFPNYIVHKEFREINSIGLGNVYSAYRSWIADFGFRGVIILQSLFALFFNAIYYLLRKTNYYNHIFILILYGYIIYPVFLHPIDDEFYKMFFNIGFIIYLLLFYISYVLLTKKFKIK